MNSKELERARELLAYLKKIQDMARSGIVMDVSALESEINELCLSVRHLMPQQSQVIAPVIAELITELDRLAKQLTTVTTR